MTLIEKIISLYPSLIMDDFVPATGTIIVQNDYDGRGDYIAEWNHQTLPRPTDKQLSEAK